MYSEEEAEILRVLLADLEAAFKIKKASRAIHAAENAYMKASRNYRDFEKHRMMENIE